MAAVQQEAEHVRRVVDTRERHLRLDRIARKQGLGDSHQRGRGREQAQAVPQVQVCRRWHLRRLQVVNRRPKQQLHRVVGALRAVDDELRRDDCVLRMDKQRLLGRQVPVATKSLAAVHPAELPEGRVPRRAVARSRARARGYQPAFHDLLQKSVRQETFTMNTAQLVRAKYSPSAFLKRLEGVKGFG